VHAPTSQCADSGAQPKEIPMSNENTSKTITMADILELMNKISAEIRQLDDQITDLERRVHGKGA